MKETKIFDYIKDKKGLKEIDLEELKRRISEMPFNQNLRILLAEKLISIGHEIKGDTFVDAALYVTHRDYFHLKLKKAKNRIKKQESKADLKNDKEEVENIEESTDAKVKPQFVPASSSELHDEVNDETEEILKKIEEDEASITEDVERKNEIESDKAQDDMEVLEDLTDENDNDNRAIEESQVMSIRQQVEPLETSVYELSDFSKWLLSLPDISGSFDEVDSTVEYNEDNISVSLAELLVNQGHFKRAISMYEKLALKNPEKSDYFAAQIEKLKSI